MKESRLQLSIEDGLPAALCAAGELDYDNCGEFAKLIRENLEKYGAALTLKLGGLDFIDSSGLRVLVTVAQDATERGRTLRITSLTSQLNHMLDVTGFAYLFEIPNPPGEPEPMQAVSPTFVQATSFALPVSLGACRDARSKVCDFAAMLGFDEKSMDDIRLAVGEAVSNAVRHGADNGDTIHIRCQAEPELLKVVMRYPSADFDPESVPEPDMEKFPCGGMGIYFMGLVTDGVSYEFNDGHATVVIEKRLNSS